MFVNYFVYWIVDRLRQKHLSFVALYPLAPAVAIWLQP